MPVTRPRTLAAPFPKAMLPKAMLPKAMLPKAMLPKAMLPKAMLPKALLVGYGLCSVASASLAAACGARTGLRPGPVVPLAPECHADADCPGHDSACKPVRCVDPEKYKDVLPPVPDGTRLPPLVCAVIAQLDCSTHDACSVDGCDDKTGCTHQHRTPDLDGDCHYAPLPGHLPGDAGSCGDDCDDSDPLVHPGADCKGHKSEDTCSKDNDCDGKIPPGVFQPLGEPLRVSGDIAPSGPGGLGYDGTSFLAVYWGTDNGSNVYETRIDTSGNKQPPIEERVTLENADGSGGPVVWVGDRYGTVWDDRRNGAYEIYFTLLSAAGKKAIADVQVSGDAIAHPFAINASLAWNQSEFIVAWQDDRNGPFDIYLQRVTVDGHLDGGNVDATPAMGGPTFDKESPVPASGAKTVGLAYVQGPVGAQTVEFQTLEQTTLMPHAGPVPVSPDGMNAVLPQIAWNKDRYVIAWFSRGTEPQVVFAAELDEQGGMLTPPRPVTEPSVGHHSRYPNLLALGGKALLVYSDDRDDNDGYELYSRVLNPGLLPGSPEVRLTFTPRDSVYPYPSFGPQDQVGVLYRDDVTGEQNVFFRRLECVAQ